MPRREEPDLAERLREQLTFLQASADAYDRGMVIEALRLATVLRTLLHDSPRSRSLLTQLGVLDDLRFLSTGTMPGGFHGSEGSIMTVLAPVYMNPPLPPKHRAPLHEAQPIAEQTFHAWWTDPVLAARGEQWTRKDLVLALANWEGGAHVHPKPKQKWIDLKRLGAGWTTGDSVSLNNPALPSVRQIAFEVEVTLRGQLGPDLAQT